MCFGLCFVWFGFNVKKGLCWFWLVLVFGGMQLIGDKILEKSSKIIQIKDLYLIKFIIASFGSQSLK